MFSLPNSGPSLHLWFEPKTCQCRSTKYLISFLHRQSNINSSIVKYFVLPEQKTNAQDIACRRINTRIHRPTAVMFTICRPNGPVKCDITATSGYTEAGCKQSKRPAYTKRRETFSLIFQQR